MVGPIDFDKALGNPAATFASPDAIVEHPELTVSQKIALLRRWEYDENEIAVATEEGMPGAESRLLQRIAAALAVLDPDGGSTAPAKQRMPPGP